MSKQPSKLWIEGKGSSFIEVTEKMWHYHMMLCKVENELSDCIYGQ
ncbi:hypothetical protein VP249E411_P0248 [Vibrio phage 249E41-1]|nr:hypothetical protein VP249E411_P0248 [Vibrio phage 249E41-1]CAH9017519.1 hypothetical protein VP193E371_P0247 [Vibrio phage 193E37-1]